MAVRDIEARTRQIASRDIRQGQEIQAAQEAQNQLLAIQAERKQQLATARVMAGQEAQQAELLAQTANVAANSSSPSIVQAPINPATQQVLSQYGVGQPNVNKVQRSTQQITKQNIVVNNYNTTTTNTTNNNNISGGGPVQGRGVVVNPNNNTNSLKVWINNWSARQNELAAKRDAEYLKRDSALERSSNKMMRRIEESTKTVATALDPRRMNNSFGEQLKGVLLMVGFGLLVKKFPVIADKISKLEAGFRNYFGIGIGKDVESGLRKDLKVLRNNFEERVSAWMKNRKDALDTLEDPKWKIGAGIGSNLKSFAIYLKDVLGVLVGGTAKRAEQIEEDIKKGVSNAAIDKAKQNKSIIGLKEEHLKTDEDGNVKLNAGATASIEAANTATLHINSAFDGGSNKKVDIESILNILKLLEEDVRENQEVVLPQYFIEALEKLGIVLDKKSFTIENGQYYTNAEGKSIFVRDSESSSIMSAGFTPTNTKVPMYVLNPDQFKTIADAFCKKVGINNENFSFSNMSIDEIAAANSFIGSIRRDAVKNQTFGDKLREAGRVVVSGADDFLKGGAAIAVANSLGPVGTLITPFIAKHSAKKAQEGAVDARTTDKTELDESFINLDKNRQATAEYNAKKKELNQDLHDNVKAVGFVENAISGVGNFLGIGIDTVDEGEGQDIGSITPEKESNEWDINKSISTLNTAGNESTGYCAGAVRKALNDGGLYPARGNAWTYNNGKLEQLGFERIGNPNLGKPFQKGDILVTKKNKAHKYGHIAMYNGQQWVSDFKQNDPDGNIYKFNQPDSYLYRYKEFGGDVPIMSASMMNFIRPISQKMIPTASYKSDTSNWTKTEKGGESNEASSVKYNELIVELKSIGSLLEQNVLMTANTADEVQKNTQAVLSSKNTRATSKAQSFS